MRGFNVLTYRNVTIAIRNEISAIVSVFSNWKHFLILCSVYLIAYAKLIFSDIPYMDDKVRYSIGQPAFGHTLRLVDELYFRLFNMGNILYDVSPLLQLLTILVLSLSSLLLLHLFVKKITWFHVFISSVLGLYPFFFESISYQIDCLFMALSIFFALLPFLYWNSSSRAFVIASIVGLSLTLLTYQQSIMVYPIIFLFLFVKNYFLDGKAWLEIKRHVLSSVASFFLVMGVYGIFIYPLSSISKKVPSIFESANFVSEFAQNVWLYFETIRLSLGSVLWLLTVLFLLYFVAYIIFASKRNRIMTLFSIIFITALLLLSTGGLVLLSKESGFELRYFLCFNVFVVGLLLLACERLDIAYKAVSLFFVALLVNIANVYGDSLDAQRKYDDFRMVIALSDLSKYIDQSDKPCVYFSGVLAPTETVTLAEDRYPFIAQLTNANSLTQYGGKAYISQYLPMVEEKDSLRSVDENKQVLLKTYYHTISKCGGCYYVHFESLKK